MDTQEQITLLYASIDLELNISNLYMLYSRLFPEDATFWWQMSMEEKNHAALLRSAEHFIDLHRFPDELLYGKLDIINGYNTAILESIARFERQRPPAHEAYGYAFTLEDSAAELHFQETMLRHSKSRVIAIFQNLCGDDKEHARRIRALMENHGLPLHEA
jgi:hypothetical protein